MFKFSSPTNHQIIGKYLKKKNQCFDLIIKNYYLELRWSHKLKLFIKKIIWKYISKKIKIKRRRKKERKRREGVYDYDGGFPFLSFSFPSFPLHFICHSYSYCPTLCFYQLHHSHSPPFTHNQPSQLLVYIDYTYNIVL